MSNLRYTCRPTDQSTEDLLVQLALDVGGDSSDAEAIWKSLNPALWERTGNPWAVLQTVAGAHLRKITSDAAFRSNLDAIARSRTADAEAPRWFQEQYSNSALTCVAYFSMEYMLSESLPIYSGGLGNVAGDQLKAANDLGVPVVAVGLLYSQGYFRQELDANGAQRALYPFNDPSQLPIRPLRDAEGDWLRISLPFPGADLWVRAWEVKVGRTRLLLLDTNDPANFPEHRCITSELYGGGPELRLRQEHVLGIGGWRLLRALDIQPEVCHLNEGHAAFAVIERAADYMDAHQVPFDLALSATRAGNLFTTHTPVEAGFDRFSADLMRTQFEHYCKDRLHISLDQLMAFGRRDPNDGGEPFNMAYLAMRGSGAANGVSQLHGKTSRALFASLFPRWPQEEVPISYVTNGIHPRTWSSPGAIRLWSNACGPDCWSGDLQHIDTAMRKVSDDQIWQLRTSNRHAMVDYIRIRYSRQIAMQGRPSSEVAAAARVLNYDALTLGFARRFATYKRPNLLLHDRERLKRILGDSRRPVQLVIAGKAHPEDGPGQAMIREWSDFILTLGNSPSVIFLSDYDMVLTQQMTRGVDVWINTPRRPWEASGTSGMKVLANGGLNLSELDGWWAEAYTPEVGWAIGDGREHQDDWVWDARDGEALYTTLEEQIIPEFYDRGATLPTRWIARIRESMARLAPQYSANRTVREYLEKFYLPAASRYAARVANDGRLAKELFAWEQKLDTRWHELAFGNLAVHFAEGQMRFEVPVYFGSTNPDDVRVELYAESPDGAPPVRIAMDRRAPLGQYGFLYGAVTPNGRNANDFTPRVVPYHQEASVPFEADHTLWQK